MKRKTKPKRNHRLKNDAREEVKDLILDNWDRLRRGRANCCRVTEICNLMLRPKTFITVANVRSVCADLGYPLRYGERGTETQIRPPKPRKAVDDKPDQDPEAKEYQVENTHDERDPLKVIATLEAMRTFAPVFETMIEKETIRLCDLVGVELKSK